MINGTITLINKNKFSLCLFIIFFISCKEIETNHNMEPLSAFQNLICDYNKDSVNIKNVETFLIFGNSTSDTIKIHLKDFQKNYKHIYNEDTLNINFEALTTISIPPHDSLGLPCMSIVDKSFDKKDKIFKEGFSIVNLKSNKKLSKIFDYKLRQTYEFQLYQKWGRKNSEIKL